MSHWVFLKPFGFSRNRKNQMGYYENRKNPLGYFGYVGFRIGSPTARLNLP